MEEADMRRSVMLAAAILVVAISYPVSVGAQTETSVTGAAEGVFPAGASYLGVALKSLKLGMGLSIAGTWAVGQFQTTLVGLTALGVEQEIQVECQASSSVPSGPNTAVFSGTCSVDPGNGTPALPGVPFTVAFATNADGTGSLTLSLDATNLPAAAVNAGYMTVQQL
jgi:hypothetical protein